jgi:hypothetical protein
MVHAVERGPTDARVQPGVGAPTVLLRHPVDDRLQGRGRTSRLELKIDTLRPACLAGGCNRARSKPGKLTDRVISLGRRCTQIFADKVLRLHRISVDRVNLRPVPRPQSQPWGVSEFCESESLFRPMTGGGVK